MRRIKDEEERKRLLQRGQELSEQYEKNRQAVHQAENDTIKKWQQQQQIEQQLNQIQTSRTPFRQNNPTPITPQVKNRNTWDNIISFFKNIGSGVENSFLSAGKYMENITENINPSYKGSRQAQFLNSPNVSTMDKARVKSAQNISDTNIIKSLNTDNGKSVEEKVKEANEKTKEETKDIVLPESNLRKNVISTRQESVQNEMANETSKATGKVSRYLIGDIAPSIGQNITQAGMSALNPALGMGFTFYSAGGSYYDDAKQRGMTDRQALLFSSVGASVEALTEQVSFQNATKAGKGIKSLISTGSLKGITKEASEDIVESTLKRALKDYGISVAEEGIQEFITTPIMEVVAQAQAGKGNFDNLLQRSLQDGLAGMISSAITGGVNIGTQSCVEVYEKVTNGQPVSQEEIIKAYNDAVKNGVQAKSIDSSLQDVYNRNISRTEIISDTERVESNGYKENLQEMLNNLEIPEEVKAQIQPMLDSNATINAEEYKDITNNIKTLVKANTQQQIQNYGIELTNQNNAIEEQRQALDNIKPETFKNKDYRRLYAQVQNESALNDETYNNILTLYPTNKNGNRPLSDWQNIAKDYGKAMAEEGRSFDEVRHNIVKIWSDEAPYSRQQSSKNGEKISRQKWYPVDQFSQAAYDSYRDTMKTQLDQQQKDLADTANARLEEIQDEENILIDTIDNLKPRIEAVKSSLVQSAEQYGYKGKQISEIQDLMKRRGINAYFDETQFNNDSEGAFYNPKTNEIVFNPNASQDQVIQELAVHEWYHDLKAKGQGEEIQQSVIDFLKNNKDYQDLRKSLENAYAKLTDPNTGEYLYDIESKEFSDMIDEEATAKTLQKVLGNETEIQRLINYKPSLARRIYDAVVDLLNKFTGGRIEKLYWQDVRNKFESAFNENGISTNEGTTRYSVKENRQYLEKQFEEMTGDSVLKADARLAGREVRNKQRQAGNLEGEMEALPYSEEAMDLYNKIKSSAKSSNYLYHSTPADRLQSIIENGLTIGNKQNQEGVSSTNKLYLSASEELANSFTPNDSITFRINPNAKLENLDSDLLGGEGAYTITNNIPPEMLQVKENGKWVRLDKSELAKTANTQTNTTDNQGRTLTKEQQEYFKDSKVRDENGNLLEVYHGSKKGGFTVFDKNKIKTGATLSSNMGDGFYFTDNQRDALEYSKQKENEYGQLFATYLNIENPFIATEKNMSKESRDILSEFSKKIAKEHPELLNKKFMPYEVYDGHELTGRAENGMTLYSQIIDEYGTEWTNFLKEKGYDGIIYDSYSYKTKTNGKSYIAFESNQIKNVDNKAPTTNSDIRYNVSLSNETNNDGEKLSNGQVNYFANSKARNSDGQLEVVYHTTTDVTSQFNEFNPTGTQYYRFGDQVVNYYTNSKDMSGSYANQKYDLADTTKLENVQDVTDYLDKLNANKEGSKFNLQKISGINYIIENSEIDTEALDFLNSLSDAERKELKDNIYVDEDMKGTAYEKVFSWDKFNEDLRKKYQALTSKYVGDNKLVDIQKRMIEYLENPNKYNENKVYKGNLVGAYDSDAEMFKNLKQDIQKVDWTNNTKLQYQGYVNITNPYVIDAQGKNWDKVSSKITKDIEKQITEIKSNEELVNKLQKLATESREKHNQYIWNYINEDFHNYSLSDSLLKDLKRGMSDDFETVLTDASMFGFTYDEYAEYYRKNGADLPSGDTKIIDLLRDYYEKHDPNDIRLRAEKENTFGSMTLNDFIKEANRLYEANLNYANEDSWFNRNVFSTIGDSNIKNYINNNINDGLITPGQLYRIAKFDFEDDAINEILGENETTNDIVKQVIEMNKNGANYDGVIMRNVIDYGGKPLDYLEVEPADLYVTFSSEQFKAKDNLNPTMDKDIRYSEDTNFDDWANNNLPSLGEGKTTLGELRTEQRLPVNQQKTTQPILPTTNVQPTTERTQTISSTIEEPTLKVPVPKGNTGTEQKVAKVLSEPITKVKPEQRAWALFKANILDKGAVFEDLSFKAKNRELQAKWDSTLLAEAKGQNAIGQARYEFENGEEKQVSKALTDIIDEVGDNSEDFNNYMYHQLNIDRMTLEDRFDIANKPVFGDGIDANYSRQKVAELEKAYPEFKEYAQDVYDYLDTNKKELVDNGVISQETSDRFKEMYPHYVPIARIDAKGLAINVPLDTNRTGVNSPIKRAKGGSQDIQPLFQTMADRTMQTYKASSRNSFGLELKNTLDNLGMFNQLETTTENADNENLFEYDSEKGNLTEGNKYQNPTFTVFENGEKVTYEINQDMYDALRPKNEIFSKWDNTKLMKATRKLNDIRRGILTEYNPAFSITNAIKDAQDVLMNSQHAGKTYAKFGEAYSQILKKGYWYKEYVQNGGSQNSYFTDGDFVKQDSKVKSIIKMPLEAISNVNNVIEMAPRLAEYIASREQGKSVQSAMLDASRVTTNFKAGGDVTKFANRNGATFLNASVQGLQQNIRNIREANAKGLKGYGVLLGKAVIAGLPALILNNLVWKDDDDYEDLQDYVKDNYYIIAKIGDHKFLRIPKGRTVAVIQKAVTNMSDFITNKDEIDPDKYSEVIWGDLKDTFELASNNLAPNNPIENNIVSPIVQAVNNKTWYGEDLVPSRLKDKPNEEKYDESTAEISKQISGVLNKIGINSNPMQINYLLDQYGGGVADVLLPMGTPQAENNMIEDKFTTDSVMKSRYPGEFFELKDKLAVNRNSSKATDEDELLYKYANNVSGELSDLYQKKREIQNSSLTDKEKKKQIAEVQKQINSKTQQALKDIKEPKVSGDTATIGNSEYIKTLNANSGEYQWNKLTDKTRIQGVSLKTQADYQNRLAKYKQKTGDSQLSDKEEAQIILDGNYSSKDKKAIYIATAGKKDTLYKSVSDNLNIDEYLNYKTANIQGVKGSNGKTINGTKKQAQLDYINNNISGYENRLLLMGKDYKLSRSQQQDLAQYIYSQDNAEELFELFDKNFTVRDGTVYYK